MRVSLLVLTAVVGLLAWAPRADATSYSGNCRLILSASQRQVCFGAGEVAVAERRLPFRPLDPSATVLGITGLSLSSVSDTIGIGYTNTLPDGRLPAINYLFGKVPAVHGYLRTTMHGDPHQLPVVWKRPHFLIVRELLGREIPARVLLGSWKANVALFSLPGHVWDAMGAGTFLTRGMAYYVTYLPAWHLTLFVTTNLGTRVAQSVGQSLADAASQGK